MAFRFACGGTGPKPSSKMDLKLIRRYVHDSQAGSMGSGEGKGGGAGGAVRSAGGIFGQMEAAREEEYFYKQQKKQLKDLRKALDDEVAHHKKHIEIHEEAIERHRKKIADILHEEKKLDSVDK